ncbi:hypothetical protein SUGI_0441470 [Cryptomeria japonica]|nr:hypothetical protein SUGI_0441470 [Cryptomeria japonica]
MGSTQEEANGFAQSYKMFVCNEPKDGTQYIDVMDKYTLKKVTKVAMATVQDIEAAIQGAQEAAPAMASMPSYERKAVLHKVVSELERQAEEIARIITTESGKPIKDSRGEVQRTIDTFQVAAEESTRIMGEYMPLDISPSNKGLQGIIKKYPIGPLSLISPWNFPLNLVAHKVAPALAVGCPFVLKPSSRTPISALFLGQILESCNNLPKGAFSILPCSRESSDSLITDDRLKLLSFTGSGTSGWDMKTRAGKKKVVMELGGNSPCIVEDLVPDLKGTVDRLVQGGFYQSGQSCIHMQRLYVREELYSRVQDALIEAVKELKMGNPHEEDTFIGPIISESAAKSIEEKIQDAVKKGGRIAIGGNRHGTFVEPTILENVSMEAQVRREEIFGPVVLMYSYRDFMDAVQEANNTQYGLQAGVFTTDVNKAFYALDHIQAGGICLNDSPSKRVDSQPYGGLKDSGIQREGVRYAMEDMLETKVLVMRNVGKI